MAGWRGYGPPMLRAWIVAGVMGLGLPVAAQDAIAPLLTLGEERRFLESEFGKAPVARERGAHRAQGPYGPCPAPSHPAADGVVGRGDVICPVGRRESGLLHLRRAANQPTVGQDIEAMICWMTDKPLQPRGRYAIKHTTRWAKAIVSELVSRLDINTGEHTPSPSELGLNALGRIKLRTTVPLVYDPYRENRTTGSFILVDEATNATVAAGMLLPEP